MDQLLLVIHESISQLQGTLEKAGRARGERFLGLGIALRSSPLSFKIERTSPE